MLKIPMLPEDPKAAKIVKNFINNRLVRMMEEIILDEVEFAFIMSGDYREDDVNKSLEELVDMDSLMQSHEFAVNVSLTYLPDDYPVEKANREFLGLYRLLKAKNEYVPELPMEYVLNSIINNEIWQVDQIAEDTEEGLFDDLMDDPFFEGIEDEEYTTIEQIPEPDRSTVLKALEKQCDDDMTAEELIAYYEDLRNYEETCFWDTDFALLDSMDEDTLIHSDFAAKLGIGERKDVKMFDMPMEDGKSIKVELNAAPWDVE